MKVLYWIYLGLDEDKGWRQSGDSTLGSLSDLNLIWFDISRVGWGWRYPESGVGWVPAGVPREFEEESWRGEGKYIGIMDLIRTY